MRRKQRQQRFRGKHSNVAGGIDVELSMSEQLRAGILLACSVTDVTFEVIRVGLDTADGQDESRVRGNVMQGTGRRTLPQEANHTNDMYLHMYL